MHASILDLNNIAGNSNYAIHDVNFRSRISIAITFDSHLFRKQYTGHRFQ